MEFLQCVVLFFGKSYAENAKLSFECENFLTSELVPHEIRGAVLVDLGGEVVSGGQVLEPEQRVPVAGAAAARVVLDNLVNEGENIIF